MARLVPRWSSEKNPDAFETVLQTERQLVGHFSDQVFVDVSSTVFFVRRVRQVLQI